MSEGKNKRFPYGGIQVGVLDVFRLGLIRCLKVALLLQYNRLLRMAASHRDNYWTSTSSIPHCSSRAPKTLSGKICSLAEAGCTASGTKKLCFSPDSGSHSNTTNTNPVHLHARVDHAGSE